MHTLNPIYIKDASGDVIGQAHTLRKALRLRRRALGIEPPFVGHPTKKSTAGRLRHFAPPTTRQAKAKLRFDKLTTWLINRAGKGK